jgi:hypothetical protein
VILFERAQVVRVAVDSIGADFESFIARTDNEAREKDVRIFQVWLPLASPFASVATDILRGQGYFIGGMLPYLPNGDGLLMQKVSHSPDWESIVLCSERAKKIGEMIRRDWKRVTGVNSEA